MIPTDGGGFDLSTPLGDPAGLRSAAARMAAAGAESGRLAHRSGALLGKATARWRGAAAEAFASVAGLVGVRLGSVEQAGEGAARALHRYASALEAAQLRMRDLQRQWRQVIQEADVERRRLAAGLPPGPFEPWELLSRGQARLGNAADDVRRELEAAARAAAAEISRWASAGLVGAAGASPAALARQAWREGWGAWSSLPAKLLQKLNGLRGGIAAYGRLSLYAEWASGLASRVSAAESALAAEVGALGETESLSALNAWMRFQETTSAADKLLAEAQPVAAFGDAASPAMSAVSRVALPLAIAGDVVTIIKPGDEQGAHATTTRVMAGANLAASGTLLAAGAGVLTLTPPGAIIVGGVLVGTAVYAVGDLVYEHREEIGHALETAGGWVVDEVETAGREIEDVASTVADGVGDAADAVGDGLSSAKDTVVGWFD
ncbi:MAG: hypothetical protein QOE64_1503 [Frankiales bacterium]|nr:hypothetical protein [Frankiales bacterium]